MHLWTGCWIAHRFWCIPSTDAAPCAKRWSDSEPGSIDFVHLSNILDWLSPEDAAATLSAAHRALKSGGFVLIRQLNSSLEIPSLFPALRWHQEEGDRLQRMDRSFFYPDHPARVTVMKIHCLSGPPDQKTGLALADFEKEFSYPLGPDRSFSISHGADYSLFFRCMGEARIYLAEISGKHCRSPGGRAVAPPFLRMAR